MWDAPKTENPPSPWGDPSLRGGSTSPRRSPRPGGVRGRCGWRSGTGRGEAGAHLSIQPVYEAHHGRDVQSRNREMGGRGKGTGWVLSHGRFSISPFFACALIIPKRDLSRRMFDLPERSSPVRSLSHRRPAPSAPSASLAPGHPTRATRPLSHTRRPRSPSSVCPLPSRATLPGRQSSPQGEPSPKPASSPSPTTRTQFFRPGSNRVDHSTLGRSLGAPHPAARLGSEGRRHRRLLRHQTVAAFRIRSLSTHRVPPLTRPPLESQSCATVAPLGPPRGTQPPSVSVHRDGRHDGGATKGALAGPP